MEPDPRKRSTCRVTNVLEVIALVGWLVSGSTLLWQSQRVALREGAAPIVCARGSPTFRIYRMSGAHIERLGDGAPAHSGDIVQLTYDAHEAPYGAILSIDGLGVVTRHLPSEGEHSVSLEQGPDVPLGCAFVLDDAPKFEEFWFVTSDTPFPLALVERALRTDRRLPSGMYQVRISLDKL